MLELELEEVGVGLRPGSPDNLPSVGPGALEGLHWATGHWRNGILLSPSPPTSPRPGSPARPLPEWAAAYAPQRFTRAREAVA